jgi:hypothetical protein
VKRVLSRNPRYAAKKQTQSPEGAASASLRHSCTTPEQEGTPETSQSFPTMIYSNLSEVAEVRVVLYPMGRVEFLFSGKALKKEAG